MSMIEFHIACILKIVLECNANVKRIYFDTAEIISIDAAFPKIDISYVICTGSSHGAGEHFKFFYNRNDLIWGRCFFRNKRITKSFRFESAKPLCHK